MQQIKYGQTSEKGIYKCTECGYTYQHRAIKGFNRMPECPNTEELIHSAKTWVALEDANTDILRTIFTRRMNVSDN